MKSLSWAMAIMALLCIQPASANWQYTKWGMTPAQVEKSSKNMASPVAGRTAGTNQIKLTAPYRSGNFEFTASFWFDQSDHLTSVSLDLNSGDAHELIGSLRNKYGEPENQMPGAMRAMKWHSGSDDVDLMMMGEATTLDYHPRINVNNRGL
jgi:hypothetical protein